VVSSRYADALRFAANAHAGQVRKGTTIPYITHPVAVSALVAQYGGDEDQMIAGLLHDVLEDCEGYTRTSIKLSFGERVAGIVEGCTDGVPGQERSATSWEVRKRAYIDHLATAEPDILLVSCCDKVHNAEAIVADLADGAPVFDRFRQGPDKVCWYYDGLASAFTARMGWTPLTARLRRAVNSMGDGRRKLAA
jgi:(p)ppGpp synthase/HD superfamily hydrolase